MLLLHKIDKQTILFVCDGLQDVWRHSQALTEAGLVDDILLVSSTHESDIPAEWMNADFWAKWKKVYLGHDNDEPGDKLAENVLCYAGREAYRVKVPQELGKDWTDFWQNGGNIEHFNKLLADAPVASGAPVAMPAVDPRNIPQDRQLLPQSDRHQRCLCKRTPVLPDTDAFDSLG